jgi:hypothetical protein
MTLVAGFRRDELTDAELDELFSAVHAHIQETSHPFVFQGSDTSLSSNTWHHPKLGRIIILENPIDHPEAIHGDLKLDALLMAKNNVLAEQVYQKINDGYRPPLSQLYFWSILGTDFAFRAIAYAAKNGAFLNADLRDELIRAENDHAYIALSNSAETNPFLTPSDAALLVSSNRYGAFLVLNAYFKFGYQPDFSEVMDWLLKNTEHSWRCVDAVVSNHAIDDPAQLSILRSTVELLRSVETKTTRSNVPVRRLIDVIDRSLSR